MGKRLTHNEFLEKFYEKNSNANNIEILGQYINTRTKIKCRCKIDNHEWEVTPYNLLKNNGCPMCNGGVKITHEQFLERFYERNSNAENIEILEQYKNARTKIKCECKICNYIWETIPNALLNQNSGCSKCAIKRIHKDQRKTHEQFIKELKEKNSNANSIEILGEYIGVFTKIKCECKICNYIWETTPKTLLDGCGCPKCSIKYVSDLQRKTHEQFLKELKEKNFNINNIEILGEYMGANEKIKCRCKIDNYIWETTPNHLLNHNSGCPQCNSSKGEKAIAKYLDEHNIKNIPQYKFDDCIFKQQLPFDFYIPSLNIAIEFDGEDHYIIFTRNKKETYEQAMNRFIDRVIRDTIKTQYCKDHNIRLIRIPYWEFDNIEKILDEILN